MNKIIAEIIIDAIDEGPKDVELSMLHDGRIYLGKHGKRHYRYIGKRGKRHVFKEVSGELRLLDSQLSEYLQEYDFTEANGP